MAGCSRSPTPKDIEFECPDTLFALHCARLWCLRFVVLVHVTLTRHVVGNAVLQFGHLEWEVRVGGDASIAGAGCLFLGAVKTNSVRVNPLQPPADDSSTGW